MIDISFVIRADLMDNPEITALCEFQPSWTDKLAEWNETLATASKSGASKYAGQVALCADILIHSIGNFDV